MVSGPLGTIVIGLSYRVSFTAIRQRFTLLTLDQAPKFWSPTIHLDTSPIGLRFPGIILPCAYVIIRRMVITVIPFLWNGVSRIIYMLVRRSETEPEPEPEQIPLEDRSVFQKTMDQFQKTGDEDNPLKAVKRIGTDISGRIDLDDSIGHRSFWQDAKKSFKMHD